MKIFATYNIKGGVGKTSTAVNLAWVSAARGNSSVLWDLDPQGAASFYYRVKARIKGSTEALIMQNKRGLQDVVKGTDYLNLDMIPADFSYRNMDVILSEGNKPEKRLRKLLAPLKGQYDVVMLDCPPSASLLSENVIYAADVLLVPLIPTQLSLRAYQQLKKFCRDRELDNVLVLPFFSMVDRRKSLHRDIVEHFGEKHPEILKTVIGYTSIVEQMGIHRAPVGSFAPSSVPARLFEALWDEINIRI
jgi:cellulose biosynthesis protein BcsQ